MRLVPLEEETPENLLSLSLPLEDTDDSHLQVRKRALISPETNYAITLILDFQPPDQ